MEASIAQGMESRNIFEGPVGRLCEAHDLLRLNGDNMMRIPFLIKGELRIPESISLDRALQAFAEKDRNALPGALATHVNLGEVQVLREPVIDRKTMRNTGEYHYSVMPVLQPGEVIERDIQKLCDELYNMPFHGVLDILQGVGEALAKSGDFLDYVRRTTLNTAVLPDFWHNTAFDTLGMLIDSDSIKKMVDRDLCAWGVDGSRFLDEWVDLDDAGVLPAPVQILAAQAFQEMGHGWAPRTPSIRAMPTRQLHITAGNAPQIPFISALRAIMTKSAGVIKSPYGATLPGALLALALVAADPKHPVTQNLSIAYWPGGDSAVEDAFFMPGSFDRIVVWGAPGAVESVKKRALFTKVLTFNPRYGVSLIGREAFQEGGGLKKTAALAAADSLVANQKACIASQIHYVEGSDDEVREYARALRQCLAAVDQAAPNYIDPFFVGELKRVTRGVLVDGEWFVNTTADGRFSSGVVVMDREIPLSSLTMQRMIAIRKVKDLAEVRAYLHHGVSTVSIHPQARKEALRDVIAASGVSNVVDLGESGTMFPGMSHDGMMVLTELVDWKNG